MSFGKRSPVWGGVAITATLLAFACGGGGGSTFDGNGTSTNGTGSNGSNGNFGLGSGSSSGGTQVPGGVPGQTISPDSACVKDNREGEQVPTDLYFMVDKTGSMECPTGPAGNRCASPPRNVSGPTRWSEMTKALNAFISDPGNAGIGAGIGFFPRADGQHNTNGSLTITCKDADYQKADVDIAELPGVAAAITMAIGQQMTAGSTPTLASITGALAYAQAHAMATPSRRTALVYATDGIPQGCDRNNTVANAAAAAQKAFAAGVPTYVLGVGPSLNSLNEIATAGGTKMAYLVDTGGDVATQLAAALKAIKSSALTCQYIVPTTSAGGAVDLANVNVIVRVGDTGTPTVIQPVGGADSCASAGGGWYYDSGQTLITLCPTTCAPLTGTPNSHLQVLIGCKTVGPPVK